MLFVYSIFHAFEEVGLSKFGSKFVGFGGCCEAGERKGIVGLDEGDALSL